MAKKNNEQTIERRAMVEKLRAEQARKEKLRGFGILGFCIVVVIALLTAALIPFLKDKAEKAKPINDLGVSLAAARCDQPTLKPATGGGKHIQVGTPIKYTDVPPAFGEHWGDYPGSHSGSSPDLRPFWTTADRPQLEYLVHSEEHGHTIVWYDDTITKGSKAYKDLENIANKLPSSDKVMVAPWTKADGAAFPAGKHLAITHWTGGKEKDQRGVWEFCGAPSGKAVQKFLKAYPASNAVEPLAP